MVKNAVRSMMCALRFPRIAQAWGSRGPLILAYHRINYPDRIAPYDLDLLSATPEAFRRQMEHLVSHYSVVSLEDIARWQRTGEPLPENAVAITFDDGYADVHTHAFPVLRQLSIPATVFVIVDAIGSDKPMWWDEVAYILNNKEPAAKAWDNGFGNNARARIKGDLKILDGPDRENALDDLARKCRVSRPRVNLFLEWGQISDMAGNGVSIGSHSFSHPVLTRIDGDRLRREIWDSRHGIAHRTGRAPSSFCYPYGLEADCSDLVKSAVSQAGYQSATTLIAGRILRHGDPLALSRSHVHHEDNMAAFKCRVAGIGRLPEVLSGLIRRVARRETSPNGKGF